MLAEKAFVNIIKKRFLAYKDLGDRTFLQLEEEEIHYKKHNTENSIYVIVKHMHGNMLSRFTDFLSTDGEKPWRERDEEFTEDEAADKAALEELWQEGWQCVFDALKKLKDENLDQEVTIRGEKHRVLDALLRQVAHYAYHVGQIVYIAKNLKKEEWQSLSIPDKGSKVFNKKMSDKYGTS